MKTSYLLRHYWRFLGFGFLMTFFCNIGQTFFIGFYNQSIMDSLHLSNADFGAVYGVASLLSAASLVWVGRLIDHVDLRHYTLFAFVGMVMACLLMAWSPSVLVMGIAIYFLRLIGQGLMPHISSTSMARYFSTGRGKAISITSLGIHSSQIILPSLAVVLIAGFGWRGSWLVYAGFYAVVAAPLVLWMLKGHTERHQRWLAEIALTEANTGGHSRLQKRIYSDLFRDVRFYIYSPAVFALPVISTAFFFYQEMVMDYKGWSMDVFALSFIVMAGSAAVASLVCGVLVDRFTTLKLMPYFLLPFTVGLAAFIYGEHPVYIFIGMGLFGLSQGAMMTMNGTLWPELYGTKSLGAIRSLMVSLMVLGTALSPAILGFVFDAGVSVGTVFKGFAVYLLLASLLQALLGRCPKTIAP